jgi:hypothetical protein
MKYNAEYDRYVTKEGLVYYYDKKADKLVLCKLSNKGDGYLVVGVRKPKKANVLVHKLVYETFKGKIPDGLEIDHEDTHKDNNALSNLKLCTHKENCNNPKTREHNSQSKIGKLLNPKCKGKPTSDFGDKFKQHFGLTQYQDMNLYKREYQFYLRHGHKCRWETNK